MKTFFLFFLILLNTLSGQKRILVGSPIRQKPAILQEFLTSLDELEQKTYQLDFCFIDDNDNDASRKILLDFAQNKGKRCRILNADINTEQYICNETTHYWSDEIIWKVAAFKDRIIKKATDEKYDYLFLIDSDIVLHPFTIDQLLKAKKDIVANVFWTAWMPGAEPAPQVWLQDANSSFFREPGEILSPKEQNKRAIQFFEKLKKPGIFEVSGLGACTLISRSALLKGVRFERIKNLNFWGEDRHFCIRAAALKIPLFLDTHLPAYHIYRESDLEGVSAFKKRCGTKITLSMIIHNEADRYLKQVLESAKPLISNAVIIDDASTDESMQVCEEILKGIPIKIVRNASSSFHQEHLLRKQQWEETIATNPDWILSLDADEVLEKKCITALPDLVRSPYADVYLFRLYDFWDKEHYRDDEIWIAHKCHFPFLVRYNPDFECLWNETPQHCGRFPQSFKNLKKTAAVDLGIKHFGWATEIDRIKKYERYKKLDPNFYAKHWHNRYESILDPNPRLTKWKE